jgi:putative oxidoreductase
MDIWQVVNVIARLLFSALFLKSAYTHLTNAKMVGGYAKAVGHVPAPEAASVGTGLMLLVGGLSILVGFHPRLGAALLVVFLVPEAFIMHGYWRIEDPMQRAGDEAHFWKDISLAGAALFIVANPGLPWPWAIG